MKLFTILALPALLLAPLPVLCAADASPSGKPNIIFIVADDLGFGDLACYGNPYVDTPVIDSLAASGVRLTHYYTPSPLCAPARAALLTGRYNHRTGAIDVSSNRGIDRIALTEKTFGDYFRHAGYATALIGKWHNGLYCEEYLPHYRGFDLFFGFPNGGHDYWKWHLRRNEKVESYDGRYMTDVLNEEAIGFMRASHAAGKPFAIWLAHQAAHAPLQAPDHLVEKYKRRLNGRYDDTVAIIYAMIERMDQGLGECFDELRRLGVLENTIVVFTSDNGAQLGQSDRPGESCYRYHDFSGNKDQVLEQGIRVPAIISWPGTIEAGRVVDVPIHGCDWLPTLFGAVDAEPPFGAKQLDGLDVMKLFREGRMPELETRFLPFQKNRYTPVAHSNSAIRRGEWKLYWPAEKQSTTKDSGRDNPSYRRGMKMPAWEMPLDQDIPTHADVVGDKPKLYNVVVDPAEMWDYADDRPEVVASLTDQYNAWFSTVKADWTAARKEIITHDSEYWRNRKPPDPGELFDGYWQWESAPGANSETDDPLKVFTGYWNYKEAKQNAAFP